VYRWTFDDGGTATTTTGSVSHTYNRLGTYTIKVVVDDGDGGTLAVQWVVNVMATGSCSQAGSEVTAVSAAWGGPGTQVTVPGLAPTFTVTRVTKPAPPHLVIQQTGLAVGPGDTMTLQRAGPKAPEDSQLQIACGPGGTRYLQAFIPRLNRTLYLQEAALLRLRS
jgi:PKD repeat protein